MKKRKSKKATKKDNREKIKIVILLILILVIMIINIIAFTIPNYANKNTPIEPTIPYVYGKIYSTNASANMLDYLYNDNNIVFSPINANVSLALFYNAADNNTKNEIKRYFANTPAETNEIITSKINTFANQNTNKTKEKYEKYIGKFIEKNYSNLSVKDIDKLTQKDREELILIIRKIEMYYEQSITKQKDKEIDNYKLSQTEKKYNGYVIKEKISQIMVKYETYQIENSIINYNEIYYQENKNTKIDKEYLNILTKYNTKLTPIDLNNKESGTIVNNNLLAKTNNQITRVISNQELTSNSLVSINSLYFNYEWGKNYNSENILDEEFVDLKENYYMVDMMYSEENYFLENEYATGFIKCFEGNKYCFVGILPKEKGPYQMGKINIESLLASKKETKTYIGMPKIKIESLNKLSNVYNKYNINEIFTDKANLHQMSNNDFYVSEIYQKETITIGEFGTVTSSTKTTALSTNTIDDSSKKVVLNRSFAFLIIDKETNDTLLIGRFDHP